MATKYSPTIGTEHVVLIFVTQYITSLTVWTPENILNYSLLGLNLNWHSDADYVGYTRRHLFQRIEEHKHSAIGKHLRDAHNQRNKDLQEQFTILKKCRGKFECLIYEMLFIQSFRYYSEVCFFKYYATVITTIRRTI